MKTIKNLTAEEIRKSILQLAIQGKLVKQDPNDEPASELVKRIYAEKQKLIKEGKIKKDKNESYIYKGDDNCYYEKIGKSEPVKLEDLPFEIPDSWCWIRLNSISTISAGGTPDRGNPMYWNGNIPWLKISDITSADKYVNNSSEFITEEGLKNSSAKIMKPGTILYTIFATIGEVGILNFEASCNQAIAGIDTHIKSIDDYLYFILLNLKDYMMSISKGCAQFNINQKILKETLIALPPLAEQKRIVEKINSIEPLLKKYQCKENMLSSLESSFEEKLKTSILQFAIEGKLVKQDPNDEPASVLLDKIKKEKERLIREGKIKRDKNESIIYLGDDKNYYEKNIPDNWTWARIGSYAIKVTDYVASGSFKSLRENVKYYKSSNYALLVKTQDFQNNFSKDLTYTDENGYKFLSNSNLYGGELILSNVGSIGKCFIVPKLNIPMTLAPNSIMVRFFDEKLIGWFLSIFQSTFGLKLLLSISSATAIKKFNKTDFKSLLVPIPPIKEQMKIVTKINQIFCLID